MATLRSLLQGPGAAGGGGTIANSGHTTSVSRQKPGSEFIYSSMCGVTQDTNYCRNQMCCWVVPPGTTCITFEIWGGGGGGAGTCCCMWGIPGQSGAWAKKTVTGTLGGCVYNMFVAYPSCCSPAPSCGYRGCQTYVTGYGLTNFCAEGGYGGCSWCFPWTNMNCGFYFPLSGCCACYFGADCGVHGCFGGWHTGACSADGCCYKDIIPMSAGIVSSDRAFYIMRHENMNSVPSTPSAKAHMGFFGGDNTKSIGTGGISSSSTGGNCYCGVGGGGGMIKVSYN